MENQKNNFLQHAIQYGIILGFIRIIIDIAMKAFNVSGIIYSSSSFIGFIIEVVLITIAIKIFRDKINNGFLSLKESLKIGIIMMIITGTFYFVSTKFYQPEFAQTKALELIERYKPEQIDELTEKFEEAKEKESLVLNYATSTLWFIALGSVIALIAGSALKKNEDNIL